MNSYRRTGKKWSTPEILRLQREYELLELDIQNIACIHNRTINAICFKLVNEKMVGSLEQIRGNGKYKNMYSSIKEEVANELSCYRLIKRNDLPMTTTTSTNKNAKHDTSIRSNLRSSIRTVY